MRRQPMSVLSRRAFLRLAAAASLLGPYALGAADPDDAPPDLLIGYTELGTDLPGGQYSCQFTILSR